MAKMNRDQRKIDGILSDVAALLNVGATSELHSGDAIARELLTHAASDLAAAYWRLRDRD